MTIWFSNTTNGFYDDTVPNMVVPLEGIQITDDVYANVVNGIQSGFAITSDVSGNPMVSNVAADAPIRVITSYSFVNRLTATERGTIVLAALAGMTSTPPNPILAVFLDDMGAAVVVNLDGATIIGALTLLTEYGLIASGRMAELLVDGTFDETTEAPVKSN